MQRNVANFVNQQKLIKKRRFKFWNESSTFIRSRSDCFEKKCWCISKKIILGYTSWWRLETYRESQAQFIHFEKSLINKPKQFSTHS